jgi:hypothetical protein
MILWRLEKPDENQQCLRWATQESSSVSKAFRRSAGLAPPFPVGLFSIESAAESVPAPMMNGWADQYAQKHWSALLDRLANARSARGATCPP